MAKVQSKRTRAAKRSKEPLGVHQFLIVLKGTDPPVWLLMAEESTAYPRCLAGARRCPPEDCGGVHGYVELLQAIADTRHPDHEEMRAWAGTFDPADFTPTKGKFDDPQRRWKKAFRHER